MDFSAHFYGIAHPHRLIDWQRNRERERGKEKDGSVPLHRSMVNMIICFIFFPTKNGKKCIYYYRYLDVGFCVGRSNDALPNGEQGANGQMTEATDAALLTHSHLSIFNL